VESVTRDIDIDCQTLVVLLFIGGMFLLSDYVCPVMKKHVLHAPVSSRQGRVGILCMLSCSEPPSCGDTGAILFVVKVVVTYLHIIMGREKISISLPPFRYLGIHSVSVRPVPAVRLDCTATGMCSSSHVIWPEGDDRDEYLLSST